MTLRDVTMLVNLSCEEASRLASESLDRDLSRSERWALGIHGTLCRSCHRMIRQLNAMRALLSKMPETSRQLLRQQLPQLSADRKQQIKQMLRDAGRADLS